MTRTYRSPQREERARRTRRQIVEAATAVFLDRGYAGTTVKLVATVAGVSVPTVEQVFGTKARLLKEAVDVAIAGDDEPVPVLARSWAAEALATGTAGEFLAVAACVLTAAQERSAGLVLAAFEGARTDPELAALTEQLAAQRTATATWAVHALAGKAPLHAEDAVETLWILMDPAVFDRLVRRHGWTPQRYRSWFARSAERLLIDHTPPRRPS